MEIALVHLGQNIPDHLETCLQQIRIFNHDITITLIHDGLPSELATQKLFEIVDKYQGYLHTIDDNLIDFKDGCLGFPKTDFWNVTYKRLYYLEYWMRSHKVTDVIHFENDVMIYFDILAYAAKFNALYRGIAMPYGTPKHAMTGFAYVKTADHLTYVAIYGS